MTTGAGPWTLRNGTAVDIRPIRPEDEAAMVDFHRRLSDRSVYYRYFNLARLDQRIRHERLQRICTIDPTQEMALVAERPATGGAPAAIIGVGRLTRCRPVGAAEVALLVEDAQQGQGLGCELMRRLIAVAREQGLTVLEGEIIAENDGMVAVARKCGFAVRPTVEDPQVVHARLELT
ncbi:MAG: N-acetyltransferase family protein [Vicinamibacterales bacterium]